MAQVLKRRSLVNSGRRRRRNTTSKKRMSAKQIKYFGTARQRAALRASSHRKRRRSNPKNYGTKFGRHWSTYKPRAGERKASNRRYLAAQSRESNPRRRRRKARRKNVGAIYSIGLAGLLGGNPGKKRRYSKKRSTTKTMARRRRRRSNAGTRRRRVSRARRVYVHRRRRRSVTSNPGSYRRRRRSSRMTNRRHRRRSNPGISGALGSTTGMFKNALSVIGGAVGSRYATQLALGASNTGAIGYLANAIAALALGWAAGKFMKSPQVGAMVTLGGFTGLALRMLSDLTPIGQYVNLSLSGAGKAGDTGIGLITDTTFYVPTVFNSGSMTSAMVPSQLTQLMAAGSVGSKAGVGSYRRRRAA